LEFAELQNIMFCHCSVSGVVGSW